MQDLDSFIRIPGPALPSAISILPYSHLLTWSTTNTCFYALIKSRCRAQYLSDYSNRTLVFTLLLLHIIKFNLVLRLVSTAIYYSLAINGFQVVTRPSPSAALHNTWTLVPVLSFARRFRFKLNSLVQQFSLDHLWPGPGCVQSSFKFTFKLLNYFAFAHWSKDSPAELERTAAWNIARTRSFKIGFKRTVINLIVRFIHRMMRLMSRSSESSTGDYCKTCRFSVYD